MKILFLSHLWSTNSHLSQYSGFQRIVGYAAKENDVTLVTWGKESANYVDEEGINIIIIKGSKKDYFFLKRIGISLRARRMYKKFDAIHALYSDCTFFLPRNAYTVTFHVLPGIAKYSELKQKVFIFLKYHLLQKRAMKRAKNIVCVSNNLLQKVTLKYKNKARFIPHGIDTDFWNPKLVEDSLDMFSKKDYFLCVGSHGLDREFLRKIAFHNPSILFITVGIKKMSGCSNIHYMYHLSEQDLRSLYHNARAVIKPLLFATANNSVLQAMAMGKLSIVSKLPGITDYLNDANCIFIDKLNNFSLEDIERKKSDPFIIRSVALQKYSWYVVLNEYLEIYKHKN